MGEHQEKFAALIKTNHTVGLAMEAHANGMPLQTALEEAVVSLCYQNAELLRQYLEADGLRPRIYELEDGRRMRWDAPDSLLKVEKLPC